MYKVVSKSICGLKDPIIIVKIKTTDDDIDFDVFISNSKINFERIELKLEKSILLKIKIDASQKKCIIKINSKEKKDKIIIKNTLIRRIFYKIRDSLLSILLKIRDIFYLFYKGLKFLWKEHHFLVPISLWKKYFDQFRLRLHNGHLSRFYNPMYKEEYNKWLKENAKAIKYQEFNYNPLISILIPVYNINRKYLSECIDSILNQSYTNFEICLVDDDSTNAETIETLKDYEIKDDRIKVKYRKVNGHISNCTNDALEMAKGEFIGLVDNDDILDKDALYYNVLELNKDKEIDFLYSDEDKIDSKGQYCYPHFKPDYSPDTLLSLNYICHFSVIRKEIVDKVGGFEVGLEGSQDYDLFLKVTEKTNKICHISKILYHWRMVAGSTAATINNKAYALDKGKIALENALKRRNIKGIVEKDEKSTYYMVKYDTLNNPLVSIIIPTRDYMEVTKKCVDSIIEKSSYKNYEIIIANNSSKKQETLDFFNEYQKKYNNFKVVECNMEFNYSKINNLAIKKCAGDYIVLLNNDTEVITPEWIEIMLGYAMQKHVGCVGAKLLYPDDMSIQHAGVILGLGGVASHAYIGASREELGLYGRLSVPYNYSANTAACLMVQKKKFFAVGGLEEQLKVAYNDVDFNLKLLEAGYYNVFLPQVELLHYESKSRGLDTTKEKYQRFLSETNFMIEKWSKYIDNDPYFNHNFSKHACSFMLDKKGGSK